ncbi:MAG TPA: amidohydrolase family protein [Lichenihabitans sp.]|jgi:predicted TIM-barrel fold metal-dependent hydrolase|nr:amidohydrolase family protein [Lichenihabitans sp.]
MTIIDAHHHIWRQLDLAWLSGPMQPRIFGPYEPIRRDYPIAEYLQDIAGTGVVGSVYVQANWPVERAEEEVAWVQSVTDETGWPQGIVGYCDMTVEDVRPALDRLTKYPAMRGIRQQFHWHANPLYRFAASPDLARDTMVKRNVARLADYGWSFDLQVFAPQMAGAAELAAACPAVTFVLQHAGMLEDLSESGRDAWREGMRALASQPNVVSKLSAFGTFIHRNDPDHIAWMVREAVGFFGAERALFGSNFPVEKLWTTYRALLDAFLEAASGFTEAERQAIFAGTARRVYRLEK